MTTLRALACVAALTLATSAPAEPPAAPGEAAAPALTRVTGGVEARSGALRVRVEALTDAILRVRVARGGVHPEDASWAVPHEVRMRRAAVTPTVDGFTTAALRVRLAPSGALTVEDLAGHVISTDAARPVQSDGRGFELRKTLPLGEHIFGLGDKTGELDRRGESFVDWNTDSYAFKGSTDPIYKSIPFFIGAGGPGGGYGLFLDNTWRTWFDFGHREAETLAIGAPDGPIDYYLIAGPTTVDVVRRYTDLTGKAPLAPRWALGYQQSRYSYMTADEVRQVAGRLRAERIPTDVMWLDIDFQDRNRPFTIDTKAFPDFPGLVKELGGMGIKLVTIADLHVADAPGQGYAPYDTGAAGDQFVHNPDGSPYVGTVWPGPSVFPDFTRAATRDWWGRLYAGFVRDGVAGFWSDMNEPSVFGTPTMTMPLDTVHRIDGDDFHPRTASHAEVHNVYGLENIRAAYDGVRRLRPQERAFIMTRASYAGGQRYAVTWTGDNSATWDHLRLAVHQILNLGLSGFSYSAADVGGFTGGPSPDLLTRWFEIGAFLPVFRDHAAKDTPRAEPWVDGPEHLAIRRRFVEARYRLMPYLYGIADQNARTGDPIMRPVFYDYPEALAASCDQSMAFTLGSRLLVAAPPKPESPQAYQVCLPAGGWYDYWTGQALQGDAPSAGAPIQAAAQTVAPAAPASLQLTETPRLDRLPVYVRAGTILPRQPLVQSTAEAPAGPLSLDVYPGEDCRGVLYDDDGHSTAFAQGGFFRQEVRCTVTPQGVRLDVSAPQGRYRPWWRQVAVTVHGWRGAAEARVAGRRTPATLDAAAATASLVLPAFMHASTVELAHTSGE